MSATAITPLSFLVDGEHVSESIEGVRENLGGAEGEVLLDFFFVQTVDSKNLQALEMLATLADARSVKIVLRGINVEIYKVLKLAGLDARFLFVN